jgi:hypothetical protein
LPSGANARGPVWFYAKGTDVVVTDKSDNFVTILKNGTRMSSSGAALSGLGAGIGGSAAMKGAQARIRLLKKGWQGPLPHGHGSVTLCILSRAHEQAVFGLFQQAQGTCNAAAFALGLNSTSDISAALAAGSSLPSIADLLNRRFSFRNPFRRRPGTLVPVNAIKERPRGSARSSSASGRRESTHPATRAYPASTGITADSLDLRTDGHHTRVREIS